MAPSLSPPTLRRRRLAAELRRLRETAGLNVEQAAAQVGISRSTLSRVETAQVRATLPVVRSLLDVYDVAGQDAEVLLQLTRDAAQRGWWRRFSDVLSSQYTDYIALESDASEVSSYDPQVVPGLLQTARYATASIRAGLVPEPEIDRRVQVRIARQERLTADPPLNLWAIIDEAVLRRPTGGTEVMREQLDRLLQATRLPNVTVQVLRTDAPVHPATSGAFIILQFPELYLPDAVYVSGMLGELATDDAEDARRTHAVFDDLRTRALDRDRSAAFIRDILKTYGT